MGVSAEFITGTVFAAVMVIIGLGAIWIVRWQTYFLLNHQSMSPGRSLRPNGNSISLLAFTPVFNHTFFPRP
jgi:hypothetical protein